AAMKVKKLMLEGGGHLNRSMIEEDLVDEMNITVAPRFIGEGVHITEGLVKRENEFKLKKIIRLDDQVVLNYKRK
ncbi:MAG: dihydrofolate reductase family protein, partial [Candidatus Altiarchaeota archaeon]|nr:dihydrofolate reductase family protein [Candidatus Altiarchaeota archaeon]